MSVFLRTAYNYDMDAASLQSGLKCEDPSLTQQQFAEETEIRTIVERFGLTGQMPANPVVPQYGDFCGIDDYQSALNAVMLADASFLELPAAIRQRFNHDPQQLLEFVSSDANYTEAIHLGLVPKPANVVPIDRADPNGPAKAPNSAS